MEEALGVRFRHRKGKPYDAELHSGSVGLVRYADDFVVFCHSREEAEEARRKLEVWLRERGRAFSEEKTRIVHLEEGFDFLGFNIRQYRVTNSRTGRRLLIRPSKKAVKKHARALRELFRKHRGSPASLLCVRVNACILGWTAYHRRVVAARTFGKLDEYLFRLQKRWAGRSHPTKSWKWQARRYWGQTDGRDSPWIFQAGEIRMRRHAQTAIKRHTLVKRFASKDDPDLEGYWNDRDKRQTSEILTSFQRRVAARQGWLCPVCKDSLNNGEELHEHRLFPGRKGGTYTLDNLQLLHLYCHQAVHAAQRSEDQDGIMPVA
jgi:RNA-directed DNA polymerase